MDNVKILEVKQSIFASNDEQAAQLRQSLKEKKIFLLNLMSAPGSGKTTTLRSTIAALKDELRIGVMEADIDSDVDAKAIAAAGAKAIQLHSGLSRPPRAEAATWMPRCLARGWRALAPRMWTLWCWKTWATWSARQSLTPVR